MELRPYFKYPSIPYLEANLDILQQPVSVFEKLDGGNCQVRKLNGRVIAGSRSHFLEGENVNRISWFKSFVRWVNSVPELYKLDERYALNGEWLAFHNIAYSPDKMNQFYLIDVFDIPSQIFLPYEQAMKVVEGMPLNGLHSLRQGKVSLFDLDVMLRQPSDFRDGIKEGLVIKDYAHQRFAKYLHPMFSEVAKGRNLPLNQKYVTALRIKKTARALLEECGVIEKDALVTRILRDVLTDQRVTLKRKDVERRLKDFEIRV